MSRKFLLAEAVVCALYDPEGVQLRLKVIRLPFALLELQKEAISECLGEA